MINFVKKFDDKDENLGFFVPEVGVFKLFKTYDYKNKLYK